MGVVINNRNAQMVKFAVAVRKIEIVAKLSMSMIGKGNKAAKSNGKNQRFSFRPQ